MNLKPNWLKQLESQSWEAELISSALAIYGSIALGDFLETLCEWSILYSPSEILQYMEFAWMYLFMAYGTLITAFILHFALRVFWIGIVGLSSVYPDGINIDSKAFDQNFLRKMKNRYPGLPGYALELDKICSVIFSLIWSLLLMIVLSIFWYLVICGLAIFLKKYVNINTDIIMLIVALVFVFVAMAGSVFTQVNKIAKTEFAQRHAFQLSEYITLVFAGPFRKPLNYIYYTLRTNSKRSSFFIFFFVSLIIAQIIASPKLVKVNRFFTIKDYIQLGPSKSDLYLDQVQRNYILLPLIQSEEVKDNYIKLFIPLAKREKSLAFSNEPKNRDLSRSENRHKIYAYRNDIAKDFYHLTIDGKRISNPKFDYIRHGHNGEPGFQSYVDLSDLSPGQHLLGISYELNYDTVYTVTREIPFYKL